MVVFQDSKNLKQYFQSLLSSYNVRIVSIDGEDGSGKSTLAEEIFSIVDGFHLNVDNNRYLDKNKGGYVKHLKYDIIRSDFDDYLSNGQIVIFDGVCNLKILQKLNFKADLRIYVKKLVYGIWGYEEKLEYSKDIKEVVKEQKGKLRCFMEVAAKVEGKELGSSESGEEPLAEEILRYHFEYKPNLNADIIFEREKSVAAW